MKKTFFTGLLLVGVLTLLIASAFTGTTNVVAQSGAEPNCVAAIRSYPGRADNVAELKPGEALVINVSRDMPSGQDSAGPQNESVAMVTLASNVKWARLVFDGTGYVYPDRITLSVSGCQADIETMQNNWPDRLTAVPDGILVFHHPYGQIEQTAQRWPDLIYSITYEDGSGVHTWQNPTPRADARMTPMPVADPGIRSGITALATPTVALGTPVPIATPDPGLIVVAPEGTDPALIAWARALADAIASWLSANPFPNSTP